MHHEIASNVLAETTKNNCQKIKQLTPRLHPEQAINLKPHDMLTFCQKAIREEIGCSQILIALKPQSNLAK